MKRKRDAHGQRRIDVERPERNFARWCEALERHDLDYKPRELLKILKTFDQGSGAWPSLATLTRRAAAAGLWSHVDTTTKYLRVLEALQFIKKTVRRRDNGSYSSNLYAIDDQRVFAPPATTETEGGVPENFGGGSRNLRGGVPEIFGDKEPPPYHEPSLSKSHDGGGPDGICKNGDDGDGVEETKPAPRETQTVSSETKPAGDETNARRLVKLEAIVWRRAWGRDILLADLCNRNTVEELFQIACRERPRLWSLALELDRIRFFALAIVAREKQNPGGWFNDAISSRWLTFIDDDAEDQARRAVHRLREAPRMLAAAASLTSNARDRSEREGANGKDLLGRGPAATPGPPQDRRADNAPPQAANPEIRLGDLLRAAAGSAAGSQSLTGAP